MYRRKRSQTSRKTAEIQPIFDIEFTDEKPQSPGVDEKIRKGLNDIMQEQRELPRLVRRKDPDDVRNAAPLSQPGITEARDIGSATYFEVEDDEGGWLYNFNFKSLEDVA